MNRPRRVSACDPATVYELRDRCQAWPLAVVRQAVFDVIDDSRQSRRQCLAVADLVASWLTEDDDSEAPPLSAACVRHIWTKLDRSRQ